MSTVFRCIIRGQQDQWEGICLDLDIAVYGASLKEVEATLAHSVQTYVEDAMKEAPAQRDKLLSRHVPWHVRLRLSVALALHMLRPGKNEGDGQMQSGFDLACRA